MAYLYVNWKLSCIFVKKSDMIKSMTGFGKAQCRLNNQDASIELRSLNGKNLDISVKLPQAYRAKEQDIRSLIAQTLVRGKIELIMSSDQNNASSTYKVNKDLIERYYHQISNLSRELGAPVSEALLPSLLRLPDVLQTDTQTAGDQEWAQLMIAIKQAIELADNYRITEGEHLRKDILERIEKITALLSEIEPLEATRTESLKTKLHKAANSINDDPAFDQNRFEQEMIYYLEKLDITEEKVRLEKHLEYFTDTLDAPVSAGKKLGFIAQEIGREINTIGSKANDASIQRIVVEMKDELEKLKEQLMNILYDEKWQADHFLRPIRSWKNEYCQRGFAGNVGSGILRFGMQQTQATERTGWCGLLFYDT